ncbi:E3 ubiquitin-protein ligase [Nymphaea thermarum]|nr:E3 ubiquitin-protein ligase [Nymphaea thermarum]
MADVSVGALVPSVTNNGQGRMGFSEKDSATESSGGAGNFSGSNENNNVGSDGNLASGNGVELDKDFLCPICMQIIKDAFLTSCGHTFCYMCIVTHLNNKNDCPCCAHYLTNNHLFPNFLLNKWEMLYNCQIS